MPNAAPTFADGVCTISTNSRWLDPNGDLPICLAQPSLVDVSAVVNDALRPDSLKLAEMIFDVEDGQRRLARWFGGERGLLIFPEYAFSSRDFAALNALIGQYEHGLIAIAPFGAVEGVNLRELLQHCVATWPEREANIDTQNRYNAGWCWIHHGVGDSTCYLFLKNFFEQKFEITVNGLTPGSHILQVENQDLQLFPVICADLISQQSKSPRVRIARALEKVPPNGPKVLVAAPLYTDKPQSNHWTGVINNIVSLHSRRAGLIFVNQLAANCFMDPGEDRWRCLSGGFVHKHVMANPPSIPLPAVRYVSTNEGSGLLLRQAKTGVAFGSFRWVNAPELGRTWVPQHRVLENGHLQLVTESIASQELRRYVTRREKPIHDNYHESSGPLIEDGLNSIKSSEQAHLDPRLWPRLLSGCEKAAGNFSPDDIDSYFQYLDRALGVFAAVEQASGASALVGETRRGQLRFVDQDVLIWMSPLHDWRKMWQLLGQLALDYPAEPQLIVIGEGRTGQSSTRWIEPSRTVDYTERPEKGNYTKPRFRHIFWRPLGEVENSLTDANTTLAQKRSAIINQLTAS